MPAPTDPKIKEQIRRAYVHGAAVVDLAQQFEISDRTIERWIDKEGWDAERKAEKAIKKVVEFARPPKEKEAPVRIVPSSDRPDEIATTTIKDLQADMVVEMSGRDKAALSKELREWCRYREELQQPRTAADFAEQLRAAGVSVREFVQALKQQHSA